MYKACIFDLDGTLLDTIETIAFHGNSALVKFGFNAIDSEKYKYFAGDGAQELVRRMLAEFGCDDEETFEKVYTYYRASYDSDMLYKTKVFDGIMPLIDYLRKNEIKPAVLSNKPHNATVEVISEFFGDERFDIVLGAREGYPHKPDPTVAFELAKELGVQPEECLYVGDTSTDMLTGKNAGFFTIGVLWGFRKRDELEKYGADIIVAKPEELIDFLEK